MRHECAASEPWTGRGSAADARLPLATSQARSSCLAASTFLRRSALATSSRLISADSAGKGEEEGDSVPVRL